MPGLVLGTGVVDVLVSLKRKEREMSDLGSIYLPQAPGTTYYRSKKLSVGLTALESSRSPATAHL